MELKLILALPLLSAMTLGIFCRKCSYTFTSFFSSSMILVSFLISTSIFLHLGLVDNIVMREVIALWFTFGAEKIYWGVYVDQLTSVMFVVVTLVSTLVHLFSAGYMKDDPNYTRYISYLSLFTFAMLLLVSADNILQAFVGWEGVGLCSYLLIGFWYKKDSANNAAIKAFIVNRIGDLAFILGIFSIIYFVGSVNYEVILSSVPILVDAKMNILSVNVPVIELIALLLFIGCMGKSAQIGLHVWLPDAMEGPTPVSALIHAATMVTAGIFLIVRISPVFQNALFTSNVILYVGAITCIFAATTAIAQSDIKKIIAYSTCSQLGYMFMACGAFAYKASIFHLGTHAFFKASLFLLAGFVIYNVKTQDINKMGGLRKYMPITYLFFVVGSLAIMGIYPFAGYYSKDLILESVYLHGEIMPYYLGIASAFFTAIYSMKILIKVFHGEDGDKSFKHIRGKFYFPHYVMILSIIPLMLLSFSSGYQFEALAVPANRKHVDPLIHYMPMIVSALGMILSILIFGLKVEKHIAKISGPVFSLIKNKYYVDELYEATFVRGLYCMSCISKYFDKAIDFCPNTFASISRLCSIFCSKCQSGYIYLYLLYIFSGLMGVISWWIYLFYFR